MTVPSHAPTLRVALALSSRQLPTSSHPPPRVVTADDLERAIDIPALLDEIAEGFVAYSAGRVVVPPVGHLSLSDAQSKLHGDVHIKYGYIEGDDVYVIKIAAGVEENAARGLPSGDGLMLVFDRRTGFTQAILIDHARLTDLRTAAAGAVAALCRASYNRTCGNPSRRSSGRQ